MKFVIVSGSHRHNSGSERMARLMSKRLAIQNVDSEIISLAGNPIPLWDEESGSLSGHWQQDFKPVSDQLKNCDALVVISPEWHGMVPAGLKNFFLLCQNKEIAHKPAAIVTVSGGFGGSYPVAELRVSSYKNTRLLYIPEHLIIRHVSEFLKDEVNPTESDKRLLERIDYCLEILKIYAEALKPQRERLVGFLTQFPNGM